MNRNEDQSLVFLSEGFQNEVSECASNWDIFQVKLKGSRD